jgi:hypothetical protein
MSRHVIDTAIVVDDDLLAVDCSVHDVLDCNKLVRGTSDAEKRLLSRI